MLFTDPTLLSLISLGGRIVFRAFLKNAVGVQLMGFLSRPVGVMLTVSSMDADRKKPDSWTRNARLYYSQ